MNKNYFLLLFSLSISFFLLVSNCFGQLTFQKVMRANGNSVANAVQQTIDGGYIILGSVRSLSPNINDVYLIKTNNQGDTLWTKTYGGVNDCVGNSVQQTKDSGYIIAGYTDSVGQNEDLYVIKTNASGNTLWTKAYGGINLDEGYFVQQTNDSGYIITGGTNSFGSGSLDVYLLKINSNGDIRWSRTYGGNSAEEGYCVKQTSDSGYIICGYTMSFGAGQADVYLIKTDVNGDTLWTKTYGGTDNEVAKSVQQTTDSGYIIAGFTNELNNNDVYLIKTDANGDTLWTKTYGGNSDDDGSSVQQTTDGGYIIGGYTTSFGAGNYDAYLIKTDVNGDTLWTEAYGGTVGDYAYSVSQTTDSGYIIAGLTYSFSMQPDSGYIYLIKTDANGNSNCYYSNTTTIVGSTAAQVSSTNTIVSSGGLASLTVTVVGSAGNDTSLCTNVGIHELSSHNTISIYPNPAGNQVTVLGLRFTVSHVEIFNVLGQVCGKSEIVNRKSEIEIDVSSLSSGIYFVRVTDEKESWAGKFVKE